MGVSIIALAIIIILVYNYYIKKNNQPEADESSLNWFQKAVYNKFYIDELYNAVIVNPLTQLSKWVYKVLDRRITDGIVNQIGLTTLLSGQSMRKLQTGGTGFYIFAMVIGIIAMLCINFLFK
jgi:NADH-quinone oxidoreductase subunit L